MNAEQVAFQEAARKLSREALLDLVVREHAERMEEHNRLVEFERSSTAITREYKKLETKYNETLLELARKNTLCRKLQEQNAALTRYRFGRHSEKADILLEGSEDENVDPLAEDLELDMLTSATPKPIDFEKAARRLAQQVKGHGNKRAGKRAEDISGIEHIHNFAIDPAELDAKYGSDGWCIVNWHDSAPHVKHVKEYFYAEITHEPVIKVKKTGKLIASPMPGFLCHGSLVTESLLALIMYRKYSLGVTLYRLENDFPTYGLILSRQDMANWIIRFAFSLLGPVYDYLVSLLMMQPYHQSDETTWEVIRDGRKAGAKSYIWVHTTSECYDGRKIVVFCYELTRGTDHLRNLYGDHWNGTNTSDAYCSYLTMEAETDGNFTVSMCFMHCRRRFTEAFGLINLTGMTEEEIQALPEAQAISLIASFYREENKLHGLCADERKVARQSNVKPGVDAFFKFVDEFKLEDPLVSNKMKDAIQYARNHREDLCLFLEDGNIPLDNGEAERCLKSVAQLRRNSLFSTSMDGAKANAIVHSIVETAKKNKANPYYYLLYLLTEMPKHQDDTDRAFLEDMLPWSDKYRQFELVEKHRPPREMIPDNQERPPWRSVQTESDAS